MRRYVASLRQRMSFTEGQAAPPKKKSGKKGQSSPDMKYQPPYQDSEAGDLKEYSKQDKQVYGGYL